MHLDHQEIRLSGDTWVLHTWNKCSDPDDCLRFNGIDDAMEFLKRFVSEPMVMMILRPWVAEYNALISLFRVSDYEFLLHFAGLLSRRELHLHPLSRPVIKTRMPEADIAPVSRNLAVPRWRDLHPEIAPQAPIPASSPPDPDTLSPTADIDAMASVLLFAAGSGTPFCEECARAAQKHS